MRRMRIEEVDLRFARVEPGGIGAFVRTFTSQYDFIFNFDEKHWEHRTTRGDTLLVQEYDVCPIYDLKPHEYWIWNRHYLDLATQGLRGNGVLTIVHHNGWPWYFGCSWTTHPLEPKYGAITEHPPSWWEAEDTFAEWTGFEELAEAVTAEQHRLLNEYHHQLLQRLP